MDVGFRYFETLFFDQREKNTTTGTNTTGRPVTNPTSTLRTSPSAGVTVTDETEGHTSSKFETTPRSLTSLRPSSTDGSSVATISNENTANKSPGLKQTTISKG